MGGLFPEARLKRCTPPRIFDDSLKPHDISAICARCHERIACVVMSEPSLS